MKKNLKPMIISALTAIAMGGIGVGTTFALFTDKAETSISVQAGKIDVSSSIQDIKTYSALYTSGLDAEFEDELGSSYKHNLQGTTVVEGVTHYNFSEGGYVTYNETSRIIDVNNMIPGDKLTYRIDFTNNSNVAYKYRLVYESISADNTLVKGLTTTTNISGTSVTYQGLSRYVSDWTYREQGENTLNSIHFALELLMKKGNTYQNKSATFRFAIEVVQGNAHVESEPSLVLLEEDFAKEATTTAAQPLQISAANESNTVSTKVSIPAYTSGITGTEDNNKSVELVVSELTTDTNTTAGTSSLSFDAKLYVEEEEVHSFDQDVLVELNIGTGYVITQVIHTISGVDTEITDYTYENGIVSFTTRSFSPFRVEYILDCDSTTAKDYYLDVEDYSGLADYYARTEETTPNFIIVSHPGTDDASAQPYVAESIATLHNAVADLPLNEEYRVIFTKDSVTDNDRLLLGFSDRDITLDLNGHDLRGVAQNWGTGIGRATIYANNSNLSIVGSGSIEATSTYNVVNTRGESTLTITDAHLKYTGTSTYFGFIDARGTVTLNGDARLTASKGQTFIIDTGASVTLNDNTYISGTYPAVEVMGGSVVVNGGTYINNGTSSTATAVKTNGGYASSSITINGGDFQAGENATEPLSVTGGHIYVNGGTYNKALIPNDKITLGEHKQVYQISENKWGIAEIPNILDVKHADESIDKMYVNNDISGLQSVFSSLEEGDTVLFKNLVYNIKKEHVASLPSNVTFKGVNGTVLNITDDDVIFNDGIMLDNVEVRGGFAVKGEEGDNISLTNCNFVASDLGADGYFWKGYPHAVCVTPDNESNVLISGCSMTGHYRGFEFYTENPSADYAVSISNCNLDSLYPVHNDGSSDITFLIQNTKLHGWNTFDDCASLHLVSCEFGKETSYYNNYNYFGVYTNAVLDNCTFLTNGYQGFGVRGNAPVTITMNECYFGETLIVDSMLEGTIWDSDEIANNKASTWILDGVTHVNS